MKVLLTGAQGQLGQTLQAQRPRDMVIASVDLPGLDITDRQDVLARVELEKPDIIVNCAAYTAVDHAESERELATSVNGDGPKNLAIAAREHGARLIHISTDFVFDGHTSKPYLPDAPAHPLSVYGASKWRGEQWVRDILPDRSIILRTSWLYGEYGGNFVSTMLNLFEERDRISVVDDQTGTPTWARSLVKAIFGFGDEPELAGTYHWTDLGQTSWYEFACAIQEEAMDLGIITKAIDILPISSGEYRTVATRPAFSVLDCSSAVNDLGLEQTPWRQNLRAMLEVSASR